MKLNFDAPEERRILANGRVLVDVVRIGEVPVLRVTHAVGWRWSTHSAEDAKAATCGNVHVGVMISGRMMVRLREGSTIELTAGDAFAIPAGHDAWTVGDEPAVLIQVDEGASANQRYAASMC